MKTTATKKFQVAASFLTVALALLVFEACYYFSSQPLDAEQQTLLAWKGVRAPDFSVTTINGRTIRLADLKGRRVILNFWATWCPPCLEELPNFIKLDGEISPANAVILGLSTDDVAIQRKFARQNSVNYPLAILQNMSSPYQDVDKIPVTMVIDRNGIIQNIVFGAQKLKALENFSAEQDFSGVVKLTPQRLP